MKKLQPKFVVFQVRSVTSCLETTKTLNTLLGKRLVGWWGWTRTSGYKTPHFRGDCNRGRTLASTRLQLTSAFNATQANETQNVCSSHIGFIFVSRDLFCWKRRARLNTEVTRLRNGHMNEAKSLVGAPI